MKISNILIIGLLTYTPYIFASEPVFTLEHSNSGRLLDKAVEHIACETIKEQYDITDLKVYFDGNPSNKCSVIMFFMGLKPVLLGTLNEGNIRWETDKLEKNTEIVDKFLKALSRLSKDGKVFVTSQVSNEKARCMIAKIDSALEPDKHPGTIYLSSPYKDYECILESMKNDGYFFNPKSSSWEVRN